jgi:MFS family permease
VRPAAITSALGLAVVAFGFQQTAVIPAIPSIQHALHASQAWSAWLQTGYLVASCVLTPLFGKLADRSGKRRMLVAALLTFLAGSIGAALAPTLGWLIAFRALQGGGGAVFPLTLAIVRDAVEEGGVASAIGALTGTFGLGTALGFGLGGAIVEWFGWRWVFAAGALAVAGATALVPVVVPRSTIRNEAGLDLPGSALLAGGLALVLVSLTEGVQLGWDSPWVIGGLLAGVALLAGWIVHDLHAEEPLLDLRVLAGRTVLLANLATIGLGFALFASFFLVPYVVQAGRGADPLEAGLYLLPAALGQLVSGPLAPRLARALSAKWVYALGLALAAVAAAGLALAHRPGAPLVVWALLMGAGAGLAIGIASDLVAEGVDRRDVGIATSLNSVLRRLGGGIGGQVAAALLAATAAGAGFAAAFWAAAGVGALGAFMAAGIPRG